MAFRAVLLITLTTLLGCSSSVAVRQVAATGPFQAEVLPVGPPTWGYVVTTDRSEGIVSVEVITSVERSKCKIDPAVNTSTFGKWNRWDVKNGLGVRTENPAGLRRISFAVTSKDAANGVVYLKVKDADGLVGTIGPISGPN